MSIVASLHRKVTDRPSTGGGEARTKRELVHYFETSPHGVVVEADGLKEIPFGEYLVEHKLITRYQLFRAMQMQDRHPAVRIGECVAALGFLQISEIERAYERFLHLPTVHAA